MSLLKYLREVFLSSLPLLLIMILITVIIFPMNDPSEYGKLAVGYISVVIGQAIFLTGLDGSILSIGKMVGGSITKFKKTIFVLLFGFLFGLLATAAEPAINVLAGQISQISSAINATLFVWIVAFGTGVAIAFAIYGLIKNLNIKIVFLVLYIAIFIMVFFVPNQYVSLAFDASGATTGDISVPFILALGLGIAKTASKSKKDEDSFGIIGIASTGSIFSVFIYGMILGNKENTLPYTPGETTGFLSILTNDLLSVTIAVIPIVVIFLFFQFFFIKLPKKNVLKILLASLVVFVGLLVFLVGIDYGFAYAGEYIGRIFIDAAHPEFQRYLIPICFVLGFAITMSEPAVVVLGEQVEGLTNGAIKKNAIKLSLAFSIAIADVLEMLRILLDVNILFFLIPLYVIALLLLPFTSKMFVGLAFDSGGVTGGAITSAFMTPLTLGVSQALGQDMLTSGLGMIAFISVTPIIIIQLLGILYKHKIDKSKKAVESVYSSEVSALTGENNGQKGEGK